MHGLLCSFNSNCWQTYNCYWQKGESSDSLTGISQTNVRTSFSIGTQEQNGNRSRTNRLIHTSHFLPLCGLLKNQSAVFLLVCTQLNCATVVLPLSFRRWTASHGSRNERPPRSSSSWSRTQGCSPASPSFWWSPCSLARSTWAEETERQAASLSTQPERQESLSKANVLSKRNPSV